MSKSKVLLTFLFCVMAQFVMAQSRAISGTVEDSMGPIMMANVVERDANNRIVSATQTDMMGNFSMEIKNPKNKLVISYVGSKTKVITIGDQTTFAIKLEDEKTTLSEVTVRGSRTGSGGLSIPKKEVSVSQQTFNLSEVEGMAFTSADEALQGEIAGLDIVSNSGNLGAGTSMRLRGVSTLSGNAEPLIVVDDKIFDYNSDEFDVENADEESFSSLLSVNVDDIASITVLKDAAATAIWGSQGANGVIQITTKRGKRGKPKVNLSYKFTGTWMPTGYELLNGDNYTMMLKEEFYNRYQTPTATTNIKEINYDKSWADYHNWSNNTDWVDAVTQFGEQHEMNFNVTGGGEKATFRISAGYNHQTGTIIKQQLDRLTTRLVLDYNVSDRIRFSTNFALTYTDNLKNYTIGSSKTSKSNNDILPMALAQAPNASIFRRTATGEYTDEYFLMNPAEDGKTPADGAYTSYELRDLVAIGNPVAYANNSWQKEQTYNIVPDFALKYELLGTDVGQHRLTFNGRVYFDIYAYSHPTYMPASLSNGRYDDKENNFATSTEQNQFKMGARAEFVFTPHFKNEDLSLTMLARYECITNKYTYQYMEQGQLPNGITSPSAIGNTGKMSNQPSSMRSASQNFIYNAHFSYKSRYNIGFSLRGDGNSKFGPNTPWFYSPSVSLRYNLSDEKFFEPLRSVVSMLGLRASWGISGSSSASVEQFFNQYKTNLGPYGSQYYATMSGIRLDDLKPQKKEGLNFGVNLGFLNDMIEVDLNLYKEKTKDQQMKDIPVPGTATWNTSSTLGWGNVGVVQNKGWELSLTANKFLKIDKFSMSANFNMAQNVNELLEMDERVLNSESMNTTPVYSKRGKDSRMNRVVVGDPLCSIYGYINKGVYNYNYEDLSRYNREMRLRQQQDPSFSWTTADYENWINEQLAAGKTYPVVTDENGKVIMNSSGEPQQMVYYYGDTDYKFQGGDAIYEDVNHDGQINELDIKYLGNSLPKMQGGFSLTLQYSNWKLVARFNYRWGNKIVNASRMALESMYGTENQCASVVNRWRQNDGSNGYDAATGQQIAVLPRACYGYGYNYQMSSRFVEDGSFLRFQNLQVSYSFPKKMIKSWGLSNLSAYVTMNNLFCWTKYSGIDPEVGAGTFTPAVDSSKTPRSKSVTASITVGF